LRAGRVLGGVAWRFEEVVVGTDALWSDGGAAWVRTFVGAAVGRKL
jgi:hypothetical protein